MLLIRSQRSHSTASITLRIGFILVNFFTTEAFSNVEIPSFIQSPVLEQVYPAMMDHIKHYGNPNVPLGTTEGKKCKTIRRLAFQNKLNEEEMELLASMNFRLNSFEDVYEEADFDECLTRLLVYEEEFKTNYQIPKKYHPDPELGAWVTMLRRIGRDHIEPEERREKLDAINFTWVNTRKCGSVFMKNFRPLKERLEACSKMTEDGIWEVVDDDNVRAILEEEEVIHWVRAQKLAAEKGNLSESRCDYLDQLPGFNWRDC